MKISKYEIIFRDGSTVTTSATSKEAAINQVLGWYMSAPESAIAEVIEKCVIYDMDIDIDG